MQVGDLVWARWQAGLVGIIIKITNEHDLDEVYYRVHWLTDSWSKESLEFEHDLLTKEEVICK